MTTPDNDTLREVAVKPLVWVEANDGNGLSAETPFGKYTMWFRAGPDDISEDFCCAKFGEEEVTPWFSESGGWEEAAKAAAQSHHSSRVNADIDHDALRSAHDADRAVIEGLRARVAELSEALQAVRAYQDPAYAEDGEAISIIDTALFQSRAAQQKEADHG